MKSRRRRPWSRGTDPPFMTTGRISASQASRLASPAVIRSPVLSNVAEPTVRSRAGRRPRQPQERPPLRPDSPDGRARRDRTRGPARPTGRRPPRAGHCPDRAAAGRSHARSPGPARATTRPPPRLGRRAVAHRAGRPTAPPRAPNEPRGSFTSRRSASARSASQRACSLVARSCARSSSVSSRLSVSLQGSRTSSSPASVRSVSSNRTGSSGLGSTTAVTPPDSNPRFAHVFHYRRSNCPHKGLQ